MTTALIDRPRPRGELREHDRADGRRLTLEERLQGVWEDLRAGGAGECPLCHGPMELAGGAGRCGGCGSELS